MALETLPLGIAAELDNDEAVQSVSTRRSGDPGYFAHALEGWQGVCPD